MKPMRPHTKPPEKKKKTSEPEVPAPSVAVILELDALRAMLGARPQQADEDDDAPPNR